MVAVAVVVPATMCTGAACQDLPGGAEHESKIDTTSKPPPKSGLTN